MKQDVEQLIKALHGVESTFWGELTQVFQDGHIVLLKEYTTKKVGINKDEPYGNIPK